jgi:hypothetical protein
MSGFNTIIARSLKAVTLRQLQAVQIGISNILFGSQDERSEGEENLCNWFFAKDSSFQEYHRL